MINKRVIISREAIYNSIEQDYLKYLESKEWMCDKSSTGAHWYLDNASHEVVYPIVYEELKCKFCGKIKRICTRYW